MQVKNKYKAIGCMSGTSLDGLDIAFCTFELKTEFKFDIVSATTLAFENSLKEKLKNAHLLSGRELFLLDHELGNFIGINIRKFLDKNSLVPDFIASHGHTVFHEPHNGGSLQIGNGHQIHSNTRLPVITDFRNMDIAFGGQGAPLVPAGDEHLFPEYDCCLNLGGFSNISLKKDTKRMAWDICPVNTILNDASQKLGQKYDSGGELGRKGHSNPEMVGVLNGLEYYSLKPPKSLGREFLYERFYPAISEFSSDPCDLLASYYEHISEMIAVNTPPHSRVLVTGGGAYNSFLIEKIKKKSSAEFILPEKVIIDYKEALIFAFLGILKLLGKNNCLASATGSVKDNIGGIIYGETN
jgi:anhydro-N-acetylmuramic acid kinase